MTTVYERFYDMTPEGQARAELDVANEAGNRLMDAYNALRAELATTRAELDAAQCRADAANRFASAAADRVLAEMERAADAWRRVAELEAALEDERRANTWWPVTEMPSWPGLYQTAEFMGNGTLCEIDHMFWGGGEWQEGQAFTDPSRITHYRPIPRPIPPAPQETP